MPDVIWHLFQILTLVTWPAPHPRCVAAGTWPYFY